jgi:stress response protein YsnF
VILREEEPVVEKRVVPRERVRLDKDTVTDQERVSEEIRKEQIDIDDEDDRVGRQERRRRR